ncbi:MULTISPECIES: endopeptidase La [Alcaligenes]|jgi:ATP-dependent Lon protease|uniref:Lon protease n=1 Tax=Alcaligenes ammonioxydans TaxID=2582914 RepID=A0ABX8ST34_9BURK|nr:endopeptidase La [Alcaligenes ammonioxydans]EJC63150.1 ATP-dependent protease La [Alcaligenes faecalis subsp. faecalis NCIB 8687]QBH20772.1 endopeptidase La [Alcaligenes faecalis]QXX78799.1 endopeptidase La [Alcaligenes ammonioxydans]WGQ36928.1 endopeptidase La [Alcaligenes faecalis]HRK84271.1 endopeptidase La [Alcaligenes faecalis]
MSASQILSTEPIELPLLPLRDVVVFPHMVIPLFVGRPRSIKALELAMESGNNIMLVAQKSAGKDDPAPEDLYEIACAASILQMLKLPDGTVKVLVEGLQRARITQVQDAETHFMASVVEVPGDAGDAAETEALRRAVLSQFEQYVKLNKKIPQEILTSLTGIDDAGRLADTIAAHLPLKLEQKQGMLETPKAMERLEGLLSQLEGEIDILQVEKRIRGRVKKQMEKSQRDYYLNEQVKAIQKELGEGEDGADVEELEKRIEQAQLSKEALKKAESEMKKLKLMSPMSAEATVVRNYIETLVGLPWRKKSRINNSLSNAQDVLDADHFGLEKVKERIVEYLAVQQRVDKLKAPILCLVGPPGVGKTSLGQSIAKATNRKFIRMALGGVRDEAEIRGHRRTYIGSMPGKVVQNMSKVGVRNPLFLLDEIDKMGADFRGDPSSALLEVLDPEQNHTFQDHYLEVDYDLSDVMFVATSNTLNIPPALLDRMEVIRLSGYTEDEKVRIAFDYLLPKLMKNNGVREGELEVTEDAVRDIVRYYTREAGVRSLEREISKICRKVVRKLLVANPQAGTRASRHKVLTQETLVVNSENLSEYLGVRRFSFGLAEKENKIGQVTGLAWTEVGGDLLTIEVADMPGKGNVLRTGSIGDVMKESVEAARTVVRSRAQKWGIPNTVFEKRDLHVHFPEGATPKDGPSAGIAITTAIVSSLTGIPVRADVAMTGEITLRGEVLPIGGLKEKLLAAQRGGIKTVMIPEENVKDLADIPDNVKNTLEIIPVRWIDRVLEVALQDPVTPLSDEEVARLAAEALAASRAAGAGSESFKH